MTDTLDTNLPEKNVELEEAKQVAEVAEQVAAAQPADAEITDTTIKFLLSSKSTLLLIIVLSPDAAI